VKTLSEKRDVREGIGWIVIPVILGEAVWSLIVSIVNNLVVPWFGDVIQQFSRLPATPFTQRPYDYPDLFISALDFVLPDSRR
jgi:large-conductance mechanosensitive channel